MMLPPVRKPTAKRFLYQHHRPFIVTDSRTGEVIYHAKTREHADIVADRRNEILGENRYLVSHNPEEG
jgi:hypothetical protein